MAERYTIKEWPSEERPRERLERLGPGALSPRELLAILIETGTPASANKPARSALDLASDLLQHFSTEEGGASLRRIMTASLAELCEVDGIGPAKATKILAAFDLGRRAAEELRPDRSRMSTPRDVYERMRLRMRDLPHEEFHVLLLNTQNEILRDLQITRGTLDASLVHPREVFRPAVVQSAAAVVLVHNHPSGDPSPSAEDRAVTRQLREAGKVVGIDVLDHVIIGEGRYASFVEAGLLDG
ncbi:MAG: DNA repair protein RadC [Gemmatimonadetes bacterium]|jgi:DNA repair protein RadC|nr:DNA repair protein RadC [Gemmatimonadota bacterium]